MNLHEDITCHPVKKVSFSLITVKSERKHFDTTRKKYRNPDIAVGHEKTKPSLYHNQGIETNKENYFSYLYDLVNNGEDFSGFSDLELSEDEVEIAEIKSVSSRDITTPELITLDDDDDDDNDIITIDDDNSEEVQKKEKDSGKKSRNLKKELSEELYQNTKKVRKIKKGLIDYSDSSDNLGSPKKEVLFKKKKRSRSSSPENSPLLKVRLKDESQKLAQKFEEDYYCEICNISLHDLEVYNSHINGRKHQKKWKLENIPEAVVKTIPSSPVKERDKYPKPPAGVMRIQIDEQAKLQDIIEMMMEKTYRAPGEPDLSTLIDLESVIEIQAMDEIKYYCSRCDSPCSSSSIIPHLSGFKHRMNNLKRFKHDEHEALKNRQKKEIESRVNSILRQLQRHRGPGQLVVERDVHLADSGSQYNDTRVEGTTSRDMAVPSTSYRNIDIPFEEKYNQSIIPNKSRSGFYCEYCKSHMMEKKMWDLHVRGTRHLKNVQKMPGMYPSKLRTVSTNGRVRLLEKIKRVYEPVVGLDQIEELQNHETKSETYKCFLCGGCFSHVAIVEHLLTTKHRLKYLEHIDYPDRIHVEGLSEADSTVRVRRMCAAIEDSVGRGRPSVHVTKDSLSVV